MYFNILLEAVNAAQHCSFFNMIKMSMKPVCICMVLDKAEIKIAACCWPREPVS